MLVVLAGLALAVAPARAAAAAPAGFVGLQSWKDPTATQWAQMRKARVKTFRMLMSWQSVQPTKGTWRWDRYERQFNLARKNGIQIMPVLLSSPSWASKDARWAPKPGTTAREAFRVFARKAADRYGPNGTWWKNHPAPTAVRARWWQVWNEPNLPNYWYNQATPNPREYAALLKETSKALNAGDSAVNVVAAGLPWGGKGLHPPEYLRRMFAVSGTAAALTSVAIHTYAKTPDLIPRGVRDTRVAMNSTSGRSRSIWITEIGWATPKPDGRFSTTESRQAAYLKDAYKRLIAVRSRYNIRGAMWFNLIDRGGSAWYYRTGLFRRTSSGYVPKPSWKAIKCVTGAGSC